MPAKTSSASPDAEDGDAPKTPKKGKKAAAKKPAASAEKRKTAEVEDEDEDDQEVVKDESDGRALGTALRQHPHRCCRLGG